MKLFIKIALLSLLPVFASAQSGQRQLDSLQFVLKNASNDTIRMNVYNKLGIFYLEINFDSSLVYLNQSIPLAQKLKLKINEAGSLGAKGYILYKLGNYPKSLETFLQALKIAEDPASEKQTWNLPKDRTPQNARLDALGYIYHNMGHLYGATSNTNKQVANYFKAISLAETVQDSFLISLANMNLGNVYLYLNKLDSALFFEQKALRFISVRKYEGVILNIIGDIYRQKGNFNQALDNYQKAVQTNKEQNNIASLGDSYNALVELYETLQKADSSLFYASLGLKNAKSIGQPNYIARAYKRLADVYSSQQNRDSTLKYLQLSSALNDSLNNVERQNLLDYQNIGFDEQLRLQKLEEEKIQMQSKIRTNTLAGALFTLIVIAFFLYRNNRQKQRAKQNIEKAYDQLKSTQSQLIQSEKMASLGELTAGIAHEIQNPLNFVNNFSELNTELIEEMKAEIQNGNKDEATSLANDISENEKKINFHGKRADGIVKGMLQHSRSSSGVKEPTDINILADEYLRLSYHGLRAKDKSFNAILKTDFDESIGKINVVPQDIGRVILNLLTNAFYSANEKKKSNIEDFEPVVSISTHKIGNKVEIKVSDNGNGIPHGALSKIFQPFFTTKPTGEGTGLGLSMSYEIITIGHSGELKVETKEGVGTVFSIHLPI